MSDMGSILTWVAPNAIWICVLIYLIIHPELAEKWGALLCNLFSHISRRAEKRSVALDIQGRINSFAKSLNREVAGIAPYGAKIEWITGQITRESFLRDNQVIIKMDYHTNQDENIVRATLEYIIRGMFPDSRPHVDEKVIKSVDMVCTKRLLEKERKSALPYYYSEILNPSRKSDEEIDRYILVAHSLDKLGYFSRILLRELQSLGVKKQFSIPEQSTKDETKRFLDFLNQKVVRKQPGVNVDPTFIGQSINISIVYVAKGESIRRHLGWIKRCIEKRIESIYLCARGPYNISLVRELQTKLKSNSSLIEIFCEEFATPQLGGLKKDNICIRYDIRDDELL